ncbi:D-alanine--D-alanine ligase family protein [Armatimonas rosea]|uniref:D-alanine--D-alanine ligase n=1 Tax=Armatimonas rosea TaxID=685828 RepID=A0A7W9SPP9_ARMRO|nr:D-alanine--D-alanine ligase [Armatimonas rosea]MBB6049724.1 D-alanine-D-alanine ligase [Armatimonas rosea]
MNDKLKVAVLMGGQSAERSVSLATGTQVLNALDPEKYAVYAIDTATGLAQLPGEASPLVGAGGASVTALTQLPQLEKDGLPDVVFIALHGPGGEDGSVQGFLETLRIPYTGSGVLASALAMDKARYKLLCTSASIPTPAGMTLKKTESARIRKASEEIGLQLGYPVVIKPCRQGSSYGTRLVKAPEEVAEALKDTFRYDTTALIEECVQGTEITVAVLGNDDCVALPPVEIIPKNEFFDFEDKYSVDGAQEICPARLSEEDTKEAKELALECHRLLGCRGMSRTDMFVTDDGCVVLETNTIPGMTPTSLLPKAAAAAGISFEKLLDMLIGYAKEK